MKTIILFSALLAFIFSVNTVSAQKTNKKILVTGRVTDAGNNPVAGAFILVDNQNTPGYTDENGYYKVKVKPNAQIIAVFTKTNEYLEKAFEGKAVLNFSFSDEPVAGNSESTTDKKPDAAINANKLNFAGEEYLKYNTIYEMIQNQVPGVYVEGKKILIREMNRMNVRNVDNSPIFMVDGMPLNTIDHIIPGNVKSITFLKGAESAKYGSMGVNGVIVIELKKGY